VRLLVLILFAAGCASTTAPAAHLHDLFGVAVGMSKDTVHQRLSAAGSLAREERKRQEVWNVRDPRFEGAIVGYDEEWKVRFITAVAKKGGERVRYADVLDVAAARHQSTGSTNKYTWRPAGAGYSVIAIGADPDVLTYVTLTIGAE
jgi:hypothetical protein